eukprot:scaffold11898_cov69-Cyclotella_meneghiniana.AAC.12
MHTSLAEAASDKCDMLTPTTPPTRETSIPSHASKITQKNQPRSIFDVLTFQTLEQIVLQA